MLVNQKLVVVSDHLDTTVMKTTQVRLGVFALSHFIPTGKCLASLPNLGDYCDPENICADGSVCICTDAACTGIFCQHTNPECLRSL